MASHPRYELGTLVQNTWKQWANAAGQEYYENLITGAIQYSIPAGWEDASTDTWVVDPSKTWPQWRNMRTGRITRTNPAPPAPLNYLHRQDVETYLRLVETSPHSHEHLYRRPLVIILQHIFTEEEGFNVFQEESRGDVLPGDSRADMAVLKILARPGGSTYGYDYCLVESKTAGRSWFDAQDHLSRHCDGTENTSLQLYGIAQVGLQVKFFTANHGVLTALSGALHLRHDVTQVTNWLEYMKRNPLPVL